MSQDPKPPQRVPTLTEVISDLPAEPAAPPQPAARGDANVASDALLAATMVEEARIAQRVIERLQGRVDVLFEHRLREALTPMVSRVFSALAAEVRNDLARKLREAVEQAVNEEMARHRNA